MFMAPCFLVLVLVFFFGVTIFFMDKDVFFSFF
jgi:hypothetical protein